jgi:hypothetical protein
MVKPMAYIFFLSKKRKDIDAAIFTEPPSSSGGEVPKDVFYDPSRLIRECGLEKVLDGDPFKYIRSAGGIWEFYLLRLLDISKRQYNHLIKPVLNSAISGCSSRQLGNPYYRWRENYPKIENENLLAEVKSFVKKLVSRKCPIRQNGTYDFLEKRKRAAKAFLNYLLGRKITQKLFIQIRDKEFQKILARLINENPGDNLFVVVGLMTCLYGGKNVLHVDRDLAHTVANHLKGKANTNSAIQKVCGVLYSKTAKEFSPPYKDIYDPRSYNRELVLIRFRVSTWLKLIGDTFDASR